MRSFFPCRLCLRCARTNRREAAVGGVRGGVPPVISFRQVPKPRMAKARSRLGGQARPAVRVGVVADKITQKHPTRRGRGARGPRPPRRGACVVVTHCRCSSAPVGLASHKKKSTLNRRGDREAQDGTNGTAKGTTRQPTDDPSRQPNATRSEAPQQRQHAPAGAGHLRSRDATTKRTSERQHGTATASERPQTANGTSRQQAASDLRRERRTRRRHPQPTEHPKTAAAANQHKKATAPKRTPPKTKRTTNGTRKHGQRVRRAGYGVRKGATARLDRFSPCA